MHSPCSMYERMKDSQRALCVRVLFLFFSIHIPVSFIYFQYDGEIKMAQKLCCQSEIPSEKRVKAKGVLFVHS